MNIIMMHETIASHDAVGNDIEAMTGLLSNKHNVYAYAITKKNPHLNYLEDAALEEMIKDPDTVILYHHSVEWAQGFQILRRAKCKIIFRYHNITPASFYEPYSEGHYYACVRGRRMTNHLQLEFPKAYWICDSNYNARDLVHVPKEQILVVPPFHKIEEWGTTTPDESILTKLKDSEELNLLFVGRVVPNKGHLLMLDVLYQYVYHYGKKVKLRIVGKVDEQLKSYQELMEKRIKEYHLQGFVELIGEVTDATLTAYYQGSDILLCCSAHEGFCVPIVEAQYFGLPIVALRYGAVPETLGEDQVILGKDPEQMAAALHVIGESKKEQGDLYQTLVATGKKNFETRFTKEILSNKFLESFETCLSKESPQDLETRDAKGAYEPQGEVPLRIGIVAPWFGENIPGGAENELKTVGLNLKKAGMEVEFLTTTVKQFVSDWSVNYYPEGTEYIWGIPVMRFPVRKRDTAAFDRINARLMMGEQVSYEEEEVFLREMVNSPALYEYLREAREKYDFFLLAPYLLGTTYRSVCEIYDKAVLIPCFHEEAYAHMEHFKEEYKKVAGMLFNAYPEEKLARSLYDLSSFTTEVMGIGVDTEISGDAKRFREKYNLQDPFLLYAGRKDAGKGVPELLKDFRDFKKHVNHLGLNASALSEAQKLKLVLIGGGSVEIPADIREDVVDLGFVDVQDKFDAFAAAVALCQLSKHESFSFVIMESWLMKRPVIVHTDCDVTRDFVERFDGGYAITTSEEFKKAVASLLAHPDAASTMGENGYRHVHENFSWDVIVEKYKKFFKRLKEEKRPVQVDIKRILANFDETIADEKKRMW